MARPKASFDKRFSDVIPFLNSAVENNGMAFAVRDYREAIHLVWRMNKCRKELRDADVETSYDRFVIRALGDRVVLEPRYVPDLSKATKLDGSPLDRPASREEAEAAMKQFTDGLEESC